MFKDIEQIKFEAKERALQNEMERNPISCSSCFTWAWGGNMSYQLHHCNLCGEKRAQQPTRGVIKTIMRERNITWDEAWDFAKILHSIKLSENSFYSDDIYFADDLYKHHKETEKEINTPELKEKSNFEKEFEEKPFSYRRAKQFRKNNDNLQKILLTVFIIVLVVFCFFSVILKIK